MTTTQFAIKGMSCQACASRIEKVLLKQNAISEVNVNFAGETAWVNYDSQAVSLEEIFAWVDKAGFTAIASPSANPSTVINKPLPQRLIFLLLLSLPFMVGMVGMVFGHHQWMPSLLWQWLLATVVQFVLALPFYRGAWLALRGGVANMDVLVVLGTTAIYLYSTGVFIGDMLGRVTYPQVYFEASVMIIAFVSLGKYLEQRSKAESLNSLGLLLKMTPSRVRVFRGNRWLEIKSEAVQLGDKLQANHGERIAADGVVIDGNGWCDESHLTGESKPVVKKKGDKVLAGAIVSGGSIRYQAQQLGEDTQLGDMMKALSEAQGSKAPIARLADRVAGVFVPTVVGIALLTFLLTWLVFDSAVQGMIHAVAVLVIACPCALGLATPAAIMVGMGISVRQGVWFKDAEALEHSSRIDTVVVDKTGTLTEGKPEIQDYWLNPQSHWDKLKIIGLVATVERYANHPLAQAFIAAAEAAKAPEFKVEQVTSVAGSGIKAQVTEVGEVRVGSLRFIGLDLPTELGEVWQVATPVAVSIQGQIVAAFALADAVKKDSRLAVERLQQMGVMVYMMSGDAQAVVDQVASQLNIKVAKGELSPRDKAQAIEQLKQQGRQVAMVGDGINDAPALAAATVSFAIKGGADIAQQAASATLMRQSVDQVADALLIARQTMTTIKQNLFFAFIYNVMGIPLAAFGLLTPIIAAAAMAMSSLSVIGNALRLKYIAVNKWQKKLISVEQSAEEPLGKN